ncbi:MULTISPECIES: DinB family protein [Arthrobacter]|uniref:DinB family protein n=1 Tax=unclassified Arthrobacter TaxID=235627 RepID=UPI0024B8FAE0|nr:DinB family protein [Arthrobacter sp. H35-MC1]MDJ0318116.1 DinB family protein [Arthrobacter sp. H35-MC1]
MPITADNKDWTWVLAQTCPECGFNAAKATPGSAATMLPAVLPRWQNALRRPDVGERPNPDTWSVLEYGAHIRDVFGVFAARLELMLSQDNPTFADWDQDQAALEGGYSQLDPAEVAQELVQNGLDAAAAFGAVSLEQWERRGLRSNGSSFTVKTLTGYFMHDVVHHLHDVDA